MRILHLIEPASPACGPCTMRMAATVIDGLPAHRHDTIVLGDSRDLAAARRCGLQPFTHIGMQRVFPLGSRRALRRALASIDASSDPFQVIHAWSPLSAVLVSLVLPHRPRLATSMIGPGRLREARLLAVHVRRAPMPLVVPSEVVMRQWMGLYVEQALLKVVSPGISCKAGASAARAEIRRQWSEHTQLTDADLVVGLLCEPAQWARALEAFEIVGRVALSSRAIRLVLHPDARDIVEVQRMARRLGIDNMLIVDDRLAEPWQVLPGLDAGIWLGARPPFVNDSEDQPLLPAPSFLPALWGAAAGIPIIVEQSVGSDEVFSTRSDGLAIIPAGDINGASATLAEWCDDCQQAHRRGVAAAELMRKSCAVDAFCDAIDETYDDLANQWTFQQVMRASSIPPLASA